MDVLKDIQESVRLATEAKNLKNKIRDMWEIPIEGLESALYIAKAMMDPKALTSRQKKIVLRIDERLRNSMFQVTPEKLLEVAREYLKFSEEVGYNFSTLLLNTKKGEVFKSVALIDKYLEAQFLGMNLSENPKEEEMRKLHSLEYLFTPIIMKHLDGSWVIQTWPNFLQGVVDGRPDAVKTFEKFQIFFGIFSDSISFIPFSEWSYTLPKEVLSGIPTKKIGNVGLFAIDKKNRLNLPAPDEMVDILAKKIAQFNEEQESQSKKLIAFLDWWNKNSKGFAKKRKTMWKEIMDPKCGLRADGRDKIKIKLEAFENDSLMVGHDFFQLFPEKDYPKVHAKFWWRVAGHPISITVNLNPEKDAVARSRSFFSLFKIPNYRGLVDEIRYFIALSAYHQIVTSQGNSEVSHKGGTKNGDTYTVVRPHFRQLHPGWQASEESIERALKKWGTVPPPSKTFVREHERGWREADDISALFAITDKDIGYVPD